MEELAWKLLGWLPEAVLNTRTRYPWFVVVSHSLYSACKFRSERRAADPAYAPGGGVASMAVAFVCYGFGGTILTDALTGHVVAVPIHPRCFPVFMACWYLVWYTPFDLVYRFAWEQKRGPLRLLMVLGEAIDSAMTPLGRITKLANAHRGGFNLVAAPMAGMLAGLCGAFWRYMDRVILMSQGEAGAKRTMEEAESATWRTAGYTALWFYFAVWTCDRVDQGHEPWVVIENDHCGTYGGPEILRYAILGFHAVWSLVNEFGYNVPHPFVYLGQVCCRFAPTANGLRVEAAKSSVAKGKPKLKPKPKPKRKHDSVADTSGELPATPGLAPAGKGNDSPKKGGKGGKKGSKDL